MRTLTLVFILAVLGAVGFAGCGCDNSTYVVEGWHLAERYLSDLEIQQITDKIVEHEVLDEEKRGDTWELLYIPPGGRKVGDVTIIYDGEPIFPQPGQLPRLELEILEENGSTTVYYDMTGNPRTIDRWDEEIHRYERHHYSNGDSETNGYGLNGKLVYHYYSVYTGEGA